MLYNVCLLDKAGTLLLSYYFGDATIDEQDAWEADLSVETAPLLQVPASVDICTTVEGRPVVLRNANQILYVVSGTPTFDELALSETLEYIIATVDAACDGRATSQKIMEFHGKIAVCLHEQFYGGTLCTTDVKAVLRNAKMKGPQ